MLIKIQSCYYSGKTKFAWFPTVVSTLSGNELVWLTNYYLLYKVGETSVLHGKYDKDKIEYVVAELLSGNEAKSNLKVVK